MKPEDRTGELVEGELELLYWVRQLELYCVQYREMTERDVEYDLEQGWRGVYAFEPEYPNVDVEGEELLYCFKPLHGPYVELSLVLLIEEQVLKTHVTELVDVMSRYGVSMALDAEEDAGPGAITLQLTLRLFTPGFGAEVFALALDNLISCKGSLIEFLLSIGIEAEPGYGAEDAPQ